MARTRDLRFSKQAALTTAPGPSPSLEHRHSHDWVHNNAIAGIIPENTKCWTNAGSTLAHGMRRQLNIKPALFPSIVFFPELYHHEICYAFSGGLLDRFPITWCPRSNLNTCGHVLTGGESIVPPLLCIDPPQLAVCAHRRVWISNDLQDWIVLILTTRPNAVGFLLLQTVTGIHSCLKPKDNNYLFFKQADRSGSNLLYVAPDNCVLYICARKY